MRLKQTLMLCLVAQSFASTGIITWAGKTSSEIANGVNTGSNKLMGLGVRLPLTLLMGSNIELGMTKLPEVKLVYNSDNLTLSKRKSYVINSIYPLSDSMSALVGVDYLKQDLACSGIDCVMRSKLGSNIKWHVGFDWLLPVISHVDSGIRILYTNRDSQEYTYGTTASSSDITIKSKKLEFQLIAMTSL